MTVVANITGCCFQASDSSPSDRTSKKSTPESSRTTPIEPLRIKVEDDEYFPDNEGITTPDSSQPSPKARTRKLKGMSYSYLIGFLWIIIQFIHTATYSLLFSAFNKRDIKFLSFFFY